MRHANAVSVGDKTGPKVLTRKIGMLAASRTSVRNTSCAALMHGDAWQLGSTVIQSFGWSIFPSSIRHKLTLMFGAIRKRGPAPVQSANV